MAKPHVFSQPAPLGASSQIAVALCVAALAVAANAQSNAAEAIVAGKGVGIAPKRQFGSCEVSCKDVCKVEVVTKCYKEPFEYLKCEKTPKVLHKKVCKDVCEEPKHGLSIYGKSSGRHLLQKDSSKSASVSVTATGPSFGDKKSNYVSVSKSGSGEGGAGHVVSSDLQVCKKVCEDKKIETEEEECKKATKDKEVCKDEEKKKCEKKCKCIVGNSDSNGNKNSNGNGFNYTLPGKPAISKGLVEFTSTININKDKNKPNIDININNQKSKPVYTVDVNANIDKGH